MKYILIFFVTASITAQSINDIAYNYGPKNKDQHKYANLYVIRPDDTRDKDLWYGIMYESVALGPITNNSKNLIQFALEGKKRFWTQHGNGSEISEVWLDLEYGKNYYLKLQLKPDPKNINIELIVLDSLKGKEEFDIINSDTRIWYSPVPPRISEGMLVGKPFKLNLVQASHYKTTDYFHFWKYKFKGPSFFQYVYSPANYPVYQFGYSNPLLSPTYSETLSILGTAVKEMKTADDLLIYVKKNLNDGNTKNKKLKLVSLEYEPLKTSLGEFGWMAFSDVEDHKTKYKGNNDFLSMRDLRVCIYVDTQEKDNVVLFLSLSCRGTTDEIYTLDEMKERMKQFLNGWEEIDLAKPEVINEMN